MAFREDAHINKLRLGDTALVQNVVPEVVTAAKTLTKADNGKVLILSASAGVTVTLPAPAAGLRFHFIIGLAFDTSNWVVATNGAAAIIQGIVSAANVAAPAVNEKQINFVNSAESLGDWAEVVSDGTNWYVRGEAALSGGMTVTAP
jgi:hypothetical protein